MGKNLHDKMELPISFQSALICGICGKNFLSSVADFLRAICEPSHLGC